jgi:predicted lipoprotein
MNPVAFIAISLLALAPRAAAAWQTPGAAAGTERYEVKSIKAVRPTLLNTIAALQKQDVGAAKASFDAFDSAWNGIEVYINTRSPELYAAIETNYEARIMKGLDAPTPDLAALLADAQAMLAKFDEAVKMVEQAPPLHPLYDDVARLRTVRAYLREVNPALKKDEIAKARQSFDAFSDNWDSIEDLVKARSREAYDGIEKGMIQIERALMPTKPDVNGVTALVSGVMDQYNTIVVQMARDARDAK